MCQKAGFFQYFWHIFCVHFIKHIFQRVFMVYKNILILGFLIFAYNAEGMLRQAALKKLNESLEAVLKERHEAINDLAVLKKCLKTPVHPSKQEWAERQILVNAKILELASKEAELTYEISGFYSSF